MITLYCWYAASTATFAVTPSQWAFWKAYTGSDNAQAYCEFLGDEPVKTAMIAAPKG